MSSKNSNREGICPGCQTYVIPEKMKEMMNQIWIYGKNKSRIELQLQCSIKPMINGTKCPCSTCLIKMVCEITCDKMGEYVKGSKLERPLPS